MHPALLVHMIAQAQVRPPPLLLPVLSMPSLVVMVPHIGHQLSHTRLQLCQRLTLGPVTRSWPGVVCVWMW